MQQFILQMLENINVDEHVKVGYTECWKLLVKFSHLDRTIELVWLSSYINVDEHVKVGHTECWKYNFLIWIEQ